MGSMRGALSASVRRRRFGGGGGAGMDLARPLPPALGDYDGAPGSPPPDLPSGALASAAPATPAETVKALDAGRQKIAERNDAIQEANIIKASGASIPPIVDPTNPANAAAALAPSAAHNFSQGPIQTDLSQAPGAVNLPLLAAAGAFLKPTHSGSFSEALGNAFEASVPVAEKERALTESSQLRKAQQDQTAAYWGAKSDTADKRAVTDAERQRASQVYMQAKAKYLGMRLDETTAHNLATEDAARDMNATRAANAATNAIKVNNQQSQFEQREQRLIEAAKNDVDYKNGKLEMERLKLSAGDMRTITSAVDAQVGQGVPSATAWTNALAGRGIARAAIGAPPSPAGGTVVGGNSASSALPFPASADQAVIGKWYMVGGTPHQWTGSGFK